MILSLLQLEVTDISTTTFFWIQRLEKFIVVISKYYVFETINNEKHSLLSTTDINSPS